MADDRSASTAGSTGGATRIDTGDIGRHPFGTVRRGFDQKEVRAYLELLAKTLEHAGRREQELLSELQEAEERARHPVIDESVLTSSLGQRSAAVLRGAHDEAARILSQSEETAATTVRDAQQQANDLQVNAESSAAERIAEAELEASSLRQQARDDAAATIEAAREEGEAVVERAREHGRAMLDQAQEARRRVLADMAHRRRLVTGQIELLRAARDEIAGSVVGVRRSLDKILEDLAHAEDSARAAAAGAARSQSVDVPEPVLVEEGERAVAELDTLGGSDQRSGATRAPGTALRFDDVATVVEKPPPSPPPPPGAHDDLARDDLSLDDLPLDDERGSGARKETEEERGPDASEPSGGGTDVDGLFARLRAREGEAAVGDDAASVGEGSVPVGEDDGSVPVGEDDGSVPVGEDDRPETALEEEPKAEASPDAQAFARRADSLDPIVMTLARRLKRALQDDQNRLLDRLRKGSGEWSDELLLDEGSQQQLYAEAAATSLRDAVSAGAVFARAVAGGRQPRRAAPDQRTVDAVGSELAATIVTLLRRRLERGETSDAAERVGAAYREWRGERIERLAEDSAVEAVSKGVLAGAGKHRVRWSRSEVGPGCADCEDNALAGDVMPGDDFPTGHRHPPAHAGCRCLVLPTPT